MSDKKSPVLTVIMCIMTAVQAGLTFMALAYAFLGTYTANKPSNFWSITWDSNKLGLWFFLSGFLALIVSIVGFIFRKKGPKAQAIVAIILMISVPVGMFAVIMGFGAHY